jgi:hypothetical protein
MPYSLCGASVANTGEQACDKAKGVAKKFFIFNGTIDAADYASEEAFLAKMTANSKLSKDAANKVFVLNEIQDFADASDSNKEGSLNQGFKTVLLEGKPGYKAKVFAGADLLKRLRKFNNQTVRIIEYDANGVFWGTKTGTAFKGYQAKLFFTGGKLATGQNVEEGTADISISYLSTSEYIDNAYWMESNGNVEDITPLLDVNLKFISNVSNVFKIGIEINGTSLLGAYNPFSEVGAAIAALTFTAGTGANYGTALAITSVAVDNTLKCLTVTFDSTAYTALAALTQIKLTPPIPAVLDASDVTETELIPVILTK